MPANSTGEYITMIRRDALLRLYNTLLSRREELLRQLNTDMTSLGGSSGGSRDEADAAFDSDSEEINSTLAERDSEELTSIDHALVRLKQGTYGTCEGCGGKISAKRLNALPYSSLCIDCQREKEDQPDWEPKALASRYSQLGNVPTLSGDDMPHINIARVQFDS
ncbi:MAG: TraR/DksA family transcriptional regulator [Planctomycetes bacterium]|jgi:DnaK suppressor protein|nr:TraR/DksA family transcriptional regulator [Planctomycetota bacterium]